MMQKIAIGVEYDGTDFYGWQSQDGLVAVQSELEKALSKIADHPVNVVCAGRTDAGVHALGQVVHFQSNAARSMSNWIRGGNANLPTTISIQWAKVVENSFHARFSAIARQYRYVIYNHPVRSSIYQRNTTWWYRPLDEKLMQEAARYLVGEHDFNAYRAITCQAKNSIRTVEFLNIKRTQDFIIIDIKANAFLHHMVRNIAGVLMAIGEGKQEPIWAQAVLMRRDRKLAGITAPSAGLCLVGVEYPLEFGMPVIADGVF